MKAKWQQFNPREQLMVIAMAVLILVYGFWGLVWQPLNDNISKTEKKIASQQSLLTWVEQKTALYRSANKSGGYTGSLTSLVNNSAKRFNLTITRMQPQQQQLQIWLDNVSFDTLLTWLESLMQQGVQVNAIDIRQTDVAGVVEVRRLQIGKY